MLSRPSVALSIVLLLLVSVPARAQQASVIGTVADETKAVLPGVTVTATNLATGSQISSGVVGVSPGEPAA